MTVKSNRNWSTPAVPTTQDRQRKTDDARQTTQLTPAIPSMHSTYRRPDLLGRMGFLDTLLAIVLEA
jgi:hypothetical protein